MRSGSWHKYKAKRTERDGQKFSSMLESRYFDYLNILQKAGEIVFFLRQVPMHLPAGVKYVVDFLVFYEDGHCEFVDVKGMETSEFKLKKKLVEQIYPVDIKIVKQGGFK